MNGIFFVTGKLGGGKTLAAVDQIRKRLLAGCRVATNLDINLEHMLIANSKKTLTRIPDKPSAKHLRELGLGYEGKKYIEKKFGLLVLDECGTWLNSRSWNDPERPEFLDFLLHARKYRWDIIFIIQDISIMDKQLRETLCEHLVICRRSDRSSIPLIGPLVKMITGFRLALPRVHLAHVKYGDNINSQTVDHWIYRGMDLYKAYDTQQVFADDVMYLPYQEKPLDMRATYTQLSAWHLKGRYQESLLSRIKIRSLYLANISLNLIAKVVFGVWGFTPHTPHTYPENYPVDKTTGRLKPQHASYLVSTLCAARYPERITPTNIIHLQNQTTQ